MIFCQHLNFLYDKVHACKGLRVQKKKDGRIVYEGKMIINFIWVDKREMFKYAIRVSSRFEFEKEAKEPENEDRFKGSQTL